MVHCSVPRCTTYSAKTAKPGIVSYHKIPSQHDVQKAWLALLKRPNLPPLKNCYVCSEHFEEICCESGTEFPKERIDQRIRRRLKTDASSNLVCCHQTVKAPDDVMVGAVGEPRFGVG